MTLAPGIAGRMRGLRGAVANRPCGCHPAAAALFAGSVPAVVALDDDDAAALTAWCRLDEFTPQERRTQQCKTLEVDVDSGQMLLEVIMDVAQPLTDFESVGADRRGTSSGVNEVVEHQMSDAAPADLIIWNRAQAATASVLADRANTAATIFARLRHP